MYACPSVAAQLVGTRGMAMLSWALAVSAVAVAMAQNANGYQTANPAVVAQRASAALKARDFETAERLYRQLAEQFPNEPGLALNLGLALYSSGKCGDALGPLERFLEAQPNHAPALLLVGVCHQKLEQPTEARRALDRAVALDPNNSRARLELADALLEDRQPDRAAEQFRRLARGDSENPRVWLGLALSYTELSRRAAESLERTASDSEYHHLLLAHSAQAQGRYRAAFAHYREAERVNAKAPGIHASVAEVYERVGQIEWAQAESAKTETAKPCDERPLECWFESGELNRIVDASAGSKTPERLYWRARAFGEMARQANERILALPPSAVGFRLMASIEDLAAKPRDAAEAWKQAVRLDPKDPSLRRSLLRSLQAAGLHDAAIREAEALLELRPDSAAAHYYKGDALVQLGRADQAVGLLEEAVGLSNGDANIRAALATAYLMVGRGPDAIPHLEAAVAQSKDERLLFQLSRAYQSAGRTTEARNALEQRAVLVRARAKASGSDEITPP